MSAADETGTITETPMLTTITKAPSDHDYASREELLSYKPSAVEDVYYPEMGKWFQLVELSVSSHDRIRETSMRPAKTKGGDPIVDISAFRRKLVIEALARPKLTAEDFTALGEVGGRLFNLLQDAAAKINGVTEDSEKEAEQDSTTTQS